MKIVFQLFFVLFACAIIRQIDAANKVAEDAASSAVTPEAEISVSISASSSASDAGNSDGKQQEIESKETDDSKLDDGDSKQEISTENARGDSTTSVADTDRKAEPTTPSAASAAADDEKPRDSEEGTVVEANPNPPPQAPQPVDPFFRPTVVYNVPSAWPPIGYPSYPSYPTYPGFEFGYPSVGVNPWLQQRVQVCPPGFTLVQSRIGEEICRRASIFHNFYAGAGVL